MNRAARKHLLIAANTTWYVYNFRGRLITELLDKGYRVSVLSPADDYVNRVTALGARHVHLPLDNDGTNPMRELGFLCSLFSILRHEQPFIILTYTPKINIYTSLVARLLKIPIIANVSGLGRAFITGGWLKTVAIGLYRFALRYPRIVFFQNDDDLNEFFKLGLVNPVRTARLPGSGVDLGRFKPESRRPCSDRTVFLLVARLMWDKGVGEFAQAARIIKSKYKDAEFQLLGFLDVKNPSAVPRSDVDSWVTEGIVLYLGPTDDVRHFYAKADCVVLPSYREGTPRTLLEASSMGIPIITTDAVGCRDVVDDGKTGFLCRVKDTADLADKMERIILMTPDERVAMGIAGRRKMEREFDEQIVIDRYMDVIEQVRKTKEL